MKKTFLFLLIIALLIFSNFTITVGKNDIQSESQGSKNNSQIMITKPRISSSLIPNLETDNKKQVATNQISSNLQPTPVGNNEKTILKGIGSQSPIMAQIGRAHV